MLQYLRFQSSLYLLFQMVERFIRHIYHAQNSFQQHSASDNAEVDFARIIDDYKTLLYNLLEISHAMFAEVAIFQRHVTRVDASEADKAALADKILSVCECLKISSDIIQERIRFLLQNRESMLIERRARLQVEDTQTLHDECRVACTCAEIVDAEEADRIADCGICYEQNVLGIRPECCERKQSICIPCVRTLISEQHNARRSGSETGYSRMMLGDHYTCSFCRASCCFKMYEKILETQ
jgi:hypothetical protein